MNIAETIRAERFRVCRQTVRELEEKLKDYTPSYADKERDAEVIASTKRLLATFRKEAAFMEIEIELEA